jgi:hypothetical protein
MSTSRAKGRCGRSPPPPADLSTPVPVWVPLTGSVELTNDGLHVARRGANVLMADKRFMVIGPIRECANQNPDLHTGVCKAGRRGLDLASLDRGPDPRCGRRQVAERRRPGLQVPDCNRQMRGDLRLSAPPEGL